MSGDLPNEAAAQPVRHARTRRLWRDLRYLAARLTRRRLVQARAAPFGLVFRGRTADVITRHIYRFGAHEPELTRFVLRHVELRPGDVVLDVGANIGWYSLLLDRLAVPGVDVFAFEPEQDNFELLRGNLAANRARHVTAVNAGVADRPGTLTLYRYKSANSGRHSMLPINATDAGVEVPVTTLESFWEERGLGERPIGFLKIDIEGYEYFALAGARTLLPRVRLLLMEFSADAMRRAQLDPARTIDLLLDAGFVPHEWAGGRLVRVDPGELRSADRQYDLILRPADPMPPGSGSRAA